MLDISKAELDALGTLSDGRWHRASPEVFFLHRKGLVDRRDVSRNGDLSPKYEYQINQTGKNVLANLMED